MLVILATFNESGGLTTPKVAVMLCPTWTFKAAFLPNIGSHTHTHTADTALQQGCQYGGEPLSGIHSAPVLCAHSTCLAVVPVPSYLVPVPSYYVYATPTTPRLVL